VVLRSHARSSGWSRSGDHDSRVDAPTRAADAASPRSGGRLHARLHPAHASAAGDATRAVEHVRVRWLERIAVVRACGGWRVASGRTRSLTRRSLITTR